MTQKIRSDALPEVNSRRWLSRKPFPNEEWRSVPGYEGLYKVSNYGRVYSLDRLVLCKNGVQKSVKKRMLKLTRHHYGYLVVSLMRERHRYQVGVHVLVGRAFIPNPDKLPQINHKDENKTNNLVGNLEWCTLQYNNNYGTRVERLSKSQRNDPKKSKPVRQLTKNGLLVREFPSVAEAARVSGICENSIRAVCRHRKSHLTAGGYKWLFI